MSGLDGDTSTAQDAERISELHTTPKRFRMNHSVGSVGKLRVALYARVSTSDQDELLQLPRLREASKLRGYIVTREYCDEASGKDGNRPGWLALLSDARAGLFDAVLVVKLDRVMRSLQLFLKELEDFAAQKIQLISLDYGDLNPSSASGKLLIHFLAAIAEWEREINSERTKEALAAKKAQGVQLGRPKEELPIHMLALYRASGCSWREISRRTGIPDSTLRYRKADIDAELEKL